MTRADLARRLTDLPPNARPWTSNLQERAHASSDVWFVFLPGELARCPECSRGLSEFSVTQGTAVRIHPDQRKQDGRNAGPTSVNGEARYCDRHKCRTYLDIRFLPTVKAPSLVDRSPPP